MSTEAALVSLDPTEEQMLQLQLLQMRCLLGIEQQKRIRTELALYDSEIELHRFKLTQAEMSKPHAEQELTRLEEELRQTLQSLLSFGEQVKTENGWPDGTHLNPDALTFTAPTESIPPISGEQWEKTKIRIQ